MPTSAENPEEARSGYCVFIDTLCQGPVPVVSDDERIVVFASEVAGCWHKCRVISDQ
jgi:hypothetical protein